MHGWIGGLHSVTLTARKIPVAIRYLLTVCVVLAVMWAWTHTGHDAQRYPYLIFLPVIFACGAIFDRGNGFLATILSATIVDYFMQRPVGSLAVADGDDLVALALFIAVGFSMAFVVEALHVGLVDLSIEHQRVQAAVRDREVLLEELSHRTRNDLANVITLLNMQARSADGVAREAMISAADRVQAIARVHRRFQIHNHRVVVDTKSYIGELCDDLKLSRLASRPIALHCESESHLISIEKAVPLGLIVNECVTNATKHAFPDERPGTISVRLIRVGDTYTLTVTDNGIGTKADAAHAGTGSRLIQMLAAQLGSTIEIEPRSPGTAVIVTIPVKSAK